MSASSAPQPFPVVPALPDGLVQLAPGVVVKYRDPFVTALLTVVTLGVYTVFWWYYINKEMADYGLAHDRPELGDDPAMSTIALFPGSMIVVPGIWTTVTTFKRVQAAQRLQGQVPINGWIGLLLALVLTPVMHAYLQSGLNAAWAAAAQRPTPPPT